jgi:hypothetical protein
MSGRSRNMRQPANRAIEEEQHPEREEQQETIEDSGTLEPREQEHQASHMDLTSLLSDENSE